MATLLSRDETITGLRELSDMQRCALQGIVATQPDLHYSALYYFQSLEEALEASSDKWRVRESPCTR